MDTTSEPLTWRTFIPKRREQLGMPRQFDLAQRLGVHQADVSRWERGAYLPPTRMLGALVDALEITADELLSLTRGDRETAA
jgi:ribosome-binding protein aMBF1 (putative translation factor)